MNKKDISIIFFHMKIGVYGLLALLLFSCNKHRIKEVTLLYYKKAVVDSVKFIKKDEIMIFEDVMQNKTEDYYKFPSQYFLKIIYDDNSIEEYDGYKELLRSTKVYTITDSTLKNRYLKLIDSSIIQ